MRGNRFFLILLFLVVWGCGENDSAVKVDMTVTEQVVFKEELDTISYAYLPQYSHTESYRRHHGLVQYLRRETGLTLRQVFPDTFDQHMKMLKEDKIDISFSNPFFYVKIAEKYHARAFARIVEVPDKEQFRGQIICRRDNAAIQTIADCRNRRWIAVDPSSAGGYLYPLGLFFNHGIVPSDFKEIAFAPGPGGKQEKVIFSVYAGKYDIGTIREGALDVVAGKIDVPGIRVIARTDPLPGWVYAANESLDKEIVEKIKQALISLDFNRTRHRGILKAADFIKVVSAQDSDFNPVRDLTAALGMEVLP
ncbi:MAG: phosphate/phosphite/phosphonate ABC transporter substrate-binding protein [Desulfobacteraceae bacterium]